jgi:hypothetical protein
VEAVVILLLAAGVSAAVVWWAMASPEAPDRAPSVGPRVKEVAPAADAAPVDGFISMPTDGPLIADDRPPAAISLIRLAITIAFVAAVWVLVITLLGWLVKVQFDDYFYRLVG